MPLMPTVLQTLPQPLPWEGASQVALMVKIPPAQKISHLALVTLYRTLAESFDSLVFFSFL